MVETMSSLTQLNWYRSDHFFIIPISNMHYDELGSVLNGIFQKGWSFKRVLGVQFV